MRREVVEIRLNERGGEQHDSWVLIRANRWQVIGGGAEGGARLFGSEITHQHIVTVEITRCSRSRDRHHDYLVNEEILMQIEMSMAQWGAFVSSFGDGTGVPATLRFLTGVGHVPEAPFESRLAESHREVREAADESLQKIMAARDDFEEAFERGDGRRALREKLRTLHYAIENAPSNMEFAAETLTKHAENVVAKARSDVEAMVLSAMERGVLELESGQTIRSSHDSR